MISPLGSYILWLHGLALAEGRMKETDAGATALMLALRDGMATENQPMSDVGLELRDGRPHSEVARTVQRAALSRLRDLGLVLRNVDEQGYTTVNVRALLSLHYTDLEYSPLGSDAHCAYVDLQSATLRASEKSRVVVELLIQGKGPQEIGEELKTNGSRRINRALAELAKILEGRYGGKELRRGRSGGGDDS